MSLLLSIMQQSPGAGETSTAMKLTLLDLTIKGGWVMIPIILLSFVATYIFIERYFVIRKASAEDSNFMNRIKDYIHEGKIDAALTLCRSNDSPSARMVEKGITRLGRYKHCYRKCWKTRDLQTGKGISHACNNHRRRTDAGISGYRYRHGAIVLCHVAGRQ
jgi:biopolymer transport protein ExbB/TolQ